MNEILKEALDKLRALEWPDPGRGSIGDALGVFVNPFQAAQAQEMNTRLQVICRTLIVAIGTQEIENEINRTTASDSKNLANAVAEKLADIATATASMSEVLGKRIEAVADFSRVAAHSAEDRLDKMGETLKAICPGCDHPVQVVNMKARCGHCGSEGHLIWNWKGNDGKEIQ